MSPRVRPGLLVLMAITALGAAEPPPRGYVCVRAPSPVVIDGRIDEAAWLAAPWTDDFVDIEGDAKPRPRFRTRARMLWDDEFFYIAAEMEEPHVWGAITAHDAVIFHDNDFEVFIDPDGDNHEYYELEINALNAEWDLFLDKPYRDGGPARNSWEVPGLKTAIHVDGRLNDPDGQDTGWSIEMAIPWRVLAEHAHRPAPPRDGDQWRVNFSRVEWEHRVEAGRYKKVEGRREDNWVWSPQGAIDMHRPERWGYVQFSALPPGRAAFVPDPAGPIRDRLIEIYQAQRSYRDAHKAWATSIDQLALPARTPEPGEGPPLLRPTEGGGYEASIPLEAAPGRAAATWAIRQDSRISRRGPTP